LPRAVTSVAAAVAYLGVEVIKAIVLSVEVSRMFPLTSHSGFSVDALQQHGMRVSQFASASWATNRAVTCCSSPGCCKHRSVGLASRAGVTLRHRAQTSSAKKQPLTRSRSTCSALSRRIGAYLLGLWAYRNES